MASGSSGDSIKLSLENLTGTGGELTVEGHAATLLDIWAAKLIQKVCISTGKCYVDAHVFGYILVYLFRPLPLLFSFPLTASFELNLACTLITAPNSQRWRMKKGMLPWKQAISRKLAANKEMEARREAAAVPDVAIFPALDMLWTIDSTLRPISDDWGDWGMLRTISEDELRTVS